MGHHLQLKTDYKWTSYSVLIVRFYESYLSFCKVEREMSRLRDMPFLHTPIRYALALVLPVAVLAITLTLWPILHDSPFLLFFAAVSVTAWLGGYGPGLASVLVSVVLVEFFLMEPRFSLPATPLDLVQTLMFAFVALLISWLGLQRRRSISATERARDELKVIMEAVTDAITAQDSEGNVLFANDAAAKLLGFGSTSSMMSQTGTGLRPRYTMISEDGSDFPYEKLPRFEVFRTGLPAEATFRMRTADKPERWIELKTSPVFEANESNVRMVVNIFRDVTRQKEADLNLASARARVQDIIDNLGTFVLVLSRQGDVLEVNATALEWLRLPLESILGQNVARVNWWTNGPVSESEISRSLERALKGDVVQFDAVMRMEEDSQRHVEVRLSSIRDMFNQVEFILLSGIDVSDRKRKEERLGQLTLLLDAQRQRLNRILNSVPGMIFETSGGDNIATQRYEFVSDQVSALLGYSPTELVGKPSLWMGMVHPEDWERAVAEAERIYRTGEAGTVGFRCVRRNGDTVHVEVHLQTDFNESGEPVGTTGVLMDITERSQAESALSEYARELRRSNNELEQFAYIASHDLQEPLRMVTSYLQLIESRYNNALDADGREFIRYAVDGGNRMKRLIQDLLTYSRVNRERTMPIEVDTGAALRTALQNMQVTIDQTQAVIDVVGPLPVVSADESQMTQLFQNLVGNALKFARPGVPPRVRITAERRLNDVIFSVADNGIGMESHYLDRIFVIFQRLHSRDKYEGTGIGLAICRKIVETHGGRIWAESAAGEGTTFYFSLPLKTNKWSYDRLLTEDSLEHS